MDRAELQAVQLALAFGLGLGLGFFYDFYRVWFRQLKGRLWPALGDIAWWLAALGLAFGGLYHINGAQLRLPVLLLAAAGVCLYLGFFSPVLFPLLCRGGGFAAEPAGLAGGAGLSAALAAATPVSVALSLGFAAGWAAAEPAFGSAMAKAAY